MAVGSVVVDKPHLVTETEPKPKYSIWRAEGSFEGNWSGAIVVNEGGDETWLPVRVNESNREELHRLLKNVGCEPGGVAEVEMSQTQKERTAKALEVMPPILAFRFGVNKNIPEEIIDYFPVGDVVPIVGGDAKPQSGKTLALISAWIVNSRSIEMWDWDPFSRQSASACVEKVFNKLDERNINPFEKLSELTAVIAEVYRENQESQADYPPPAIRLGEMMDQAIANYLSYVAGQKLVVLADVSGYTENTKRWSPFRILGKILPSINLNSDSSGGIPPEFMPPEGPTEAGYYYVLYDRIMSNLGRVYEGRTYLREGNEGQYLKVLSKAREDQKQWQEYLRFPTSMAV